VYHTSDPEVEGGVGSASGSNPPVKPIAAITVTAIRRITVIISRMVLIAYHP